MTGELKVTTPSFRFDRLKSCYGKREKAWKKCETCPHIERCSADTLVRALSEEGFKVDTSHHGELIHVDRVGEGNK